MKNHEWNEAAQVKSVMAYTAWYKDLVKYYLAGCQQIWFSENTSTKTEKNSRN